ncbi:Hypothetical predicted protein [Olea europaea subsp. europaea]|uniref:Uncharacterized protein n=1 Tax=Olea europaea subsp. europaea TaxID=158383 RepID=A0A8S0PYZ7_OLEEU|nr:Hypothetical predicted protein [Olea europaea subsp. europaea]
MEATLPSAVWLIFLGLLQDGLQWRVGDGRSIHIFRESRPIKEAFWSYTPSWGVIISQVFPLDLFSLKTYLPDGDLDDLTAIGVHKDFVQRSYGL